MKLNEVLSKDIPITGAAEAQWDIWKGRGLYLDLGNTGFSGWSGSVLFDRDSQLIWEFTYFPKDGSKPLRWMDPNIRDGYVQESTRRGVNPNSAYDDVLFLDVEDPAQIIEAMLMAEKEEDARETEESV
jgi:hypothetical protein